MSRVPTFLMSHAHPLMNLTHLMPHAPNVPDAHPPTVPVPDVFFCACTQCLMLVHPLLFMQVVELFSLMYMQKYMGLPTQASTPEQVTQGLQLHLLHCHNPSRQLQLNVCQGLPSFLLTSDSME